MSRLTRTATTGRLSFERVDMDPLPEVISPAITRAADTCESVVMSEKPLPLNHTHRPHFVNVTKRVGRARPSRRGKQAERIALGARTSETLPRTWIAPTAYCGPGRYQSAMGVIRHSDVFVLRRRTARLARGVGCRGAIARLRGEVHWTVRHTGARWENCESRNATTLGASQVVRTPPGEWAGTLSATGQVSAGSGRLPATPRPLYW